MDKSDNYTKFPNDVLEELYKHHFSAQQIQIILYIVRKIAGYRKNKDTIAISKMARDLGRTRESTSRVVKKLEELEILEVERTGKKTGNIMRMKSVSEWESPVTKRSHVTKQSHVTKRSTDPCPNGHTTCDRAITHKRKYTKENIQKKPPKPPIEDEEDFVRDFASLYNDEEDDW